MAKRKAETKRAAPRRRAASAAPRRRSYRRKSGTTYIPSAAATIGAAVANMPAINAVLQDMSVNGVKQAIRTATTPEQLKKTALYVGGAYVAGEAVKRYAPAIIKTPAGKIAKKIPRFF